MPNGYYTPGRKAQYGKVRWQRYESLRVAGFKKDEARFLLRIDHPDDTPILASMARERYRFLRAFEREVARQGWTQGQARYRYYRALKEDNRRRGFTAKGVGLLPEKRLRAILMARFHVHENRIRKAAGWQKGEYDPDNPEKERVRRRTKPKTPLKKGAAKGRGQVDAQKARANARKKATRAEENVGKLRRDILEKEIAMAPHGIATAKDPKIKSALRARYRSLQGRWDTIKDTGAKYG